MGAPACLARKPVSAAVTVAGSSTKGQWPLRSSTRISACGNAARWRRHEGDGEVGVVAAPEHERGPVERAQRRGEPLAGGGDVGDGAVQLEHGATGGAVEVVVHAVDERPRQPARVAAPQQRGESRRGSRRP